MISRVLKVVGGISAAVLIIVGVIQISDWISRRSASLVAEVHLGEFPVPPDIRDQLDGLTDGDYVAQLLDPSEHLEDIKDAGRRDSAWKAMARELAHQLGKEIPREIRRDWGYGHFWRMTIRNRSRSTAEAVDLTVPGAAHVWILREDDQTSGPVKAPVIHLGTMRPGESVRVTVWTTQSTHFRDAENIKLVHADGYGKLVFFQRVAPFWHWLSKFWWFLLLMLAAAGCLGMAIWSYRSTDSATAEPEQSGGGASGEPPN